MHKGRTYPYAPQYWATECFFWPGYVPWKFLGFVVGTQPAPWDQIDGSFDQVSSPVDYVPDATQCFYEWALSPPSVADRLKLSLEQIAYGGVNYARWKAVLLLVGVDVATAYLFQLHPQYVCSAVAARWWISNDPTIPPDGPYLNFRPATYAEGGSPW